MPESDPYVETIKIFHHELVILRRLVALILGLVLGDIIVRFINRVFGS